MSFANNLHIYPQRREHELVLQALAKVPEGRRCYRMVGGILAESRRIFSGWMNTSTVVVYAFDDEDVCNCGHQHEDHRRVV